MKIFITGSSDGLGLFCAKALLNLGHEVVLHAKNDQRADELKSQFKTDVEILIADLSSFDETKELANKLNTLGRFDVIIHNAGVLKASKQDILKVNVLAPYILTSLVKKPKKIIYIGSNMHPQGDINFEDLSIEEGVDYSTSKLQILMLGLLFSKRLKDTKIFIVDPGWVKTKMADYNAPDSLEDGSQTQIWLASNDNLNTNSIYYFHQKEASYSSKADNIKAQELLLKKCEELTNLHFLEN